MIPFEQAKNLKKGDVVFDGKFTCYVVKKKVDKEAQTVAITYTDGDDGGDEFDGNNENLFLTRQGPEFLWSKNAPAKVEPPTPKPTPKKRRPELPPLPKATGDVLMRINAGLARNEKWCSLGWFEEDRSKIAKDISDKLGISISEFADTPETASFHFMTLALAIGKWLHKSGWAEIGMRDERAMNQYEELARSKAVAGILVRLFGHSYVQDIGQMQGLGSMVKAFTMASGVTETMFGHILTAHTYVRQSALLMARFLADGSPDGGSPVTLDFFDAYNEFLENDPDEFMPPDAVMDASIQIFSTIKYLHQKASLPASLDELPEDEAKAHHYLHKFSMLAGIYRTPATLQLGKLSFKGASLDSALDSLADKKPLVLLDTIFQDGEESLNIVVPFNPMTQLADAKAMPAHLAKECEKLPSMPAMSMAMYPMA